MSSMAGTAKDAVDTLREEGVKAGLLKLRVFRPFPAEELVAALSGLQAVAICDRAASFGGAGGPLYAEITSALYVAGASVPAVNYIYGLGGRQIAPDEIISMYRDLERVAEEGQPDQPTRFSSVR